MEGNEKVDGNGVIVLPRLAFAPPKKRKGSVKRVALDDLQHHARKVEVQRKQKRDSLNKYFVHPRDRVEGEYISDTEIAKLWLMSWVEQVLESVRNIFAFMGRHLVAVGIVLLFGFIGLSKAMDVSWYQGGLYALGFSLVALMVVMIFLWGLKTVLIRTHVTVIWFIVTILGMAFASYDASKVWVLGVILALIVIVPLGRVLTSLLHAPLSVQAIFRYWGFITGDVDNLLRDRAEWRHNHTNLLCRFPAPAILQEESS